MFSEIISIPIMLLIVSLIGYIFVVIKEKLYLKKNMIVINKKAVTENYLKEAETKAFLLGGKHIKSGDEVRFVLNNEEKLEGIVIGAKKKDNSILLVTHKDSVERFNVKNVKRFKIISKYGKFFKKI
ncbi:hypothetical protein [Dethiothermospora halolimnae]|uniref:hypothetical protein n=1 Tax=Dethiothermospora halolimnae TaxID=3114390 RepID=UPI003CCBAE18